MQSGGVEKTVGTHRNVIRSTLAMARACSVAFQHSGLRTDGHVESTKLSCPLSSWSNHTYLPEGRATHQQNPQPNGHGFKKAGRISSHTNARARAHSRTKMHAHDANARTRTHSHHNEHTQHTKHTKHTRHSSAHTHTHTHTQTHTHTHALHKIDSGKHEHCVVPLTTVQHVGICPPLRQIGTHTR